MDASNMEKCFVTQEHIDAIRAAGLSAETLAYSISGSASDIECFFDSGVDEAIDETMNGSRDAFYNYITGIFPEQTALLLAEKLTKLGGFLSPGGFDEFIPGLIERLQSVNLLSLGQISDLTGLAPDMLSNYKRDPGSIPCDDRHHIAAEIQKLDTVLNYKRV